MRAVLTRRLLCCAVLTAPVLVGIAGPASPAAAVAPFKVATTSLPGATPGTPYAAVTLRAANVGVSVSPYVTTLKWKKVYGPTGLKVSKAGVLSGTPRKKLAAGTSSITVKVTERMTTLNGKKKVRTKTTVEATIPLTVT
ncbi:MAG: hypothetical protein ABSF33_16940 [Acidimicrobiales bacterium]|jgi:hypothetical protein